MKINQLTLTWEKKLIKSFSWKVSVLLTSLWQIKSSDRAFIFADSHWLTLALPVFNGYQWIYSFGQVFIDSSEFSMSFIHSKYFHRL